MVRTSIPQLLGNTNVAKAEDDDKYPAKIIKLFAPRFPFLYARPIDYPPERRATRSIGSIAPWRLAIEEYKSKFAAQSDAKPKKLSKKEVHEASYKRQLDEWNDGEAFAKNESLKDPYRTVFVARLYYTLTEVDLSKLFAQYGSIESVKIIRDMDGRSRGYGFVVFEREADASNCIRELAPTGLSTEAPSPEVKARKILVDRERGRLVRNWKPRRLAGGLGGRNYTLASYHSRDASAASTGRRMNLSQNPYQLAQGRFNKRPLADQYGGSAKRSGPDSDYYLNAPAFSSNSSYSLSYSSSHAAPPQPYISGATAFADSTHTPAARGDSIKDKYAKYQSISQSGLLARDSGRSIRSIRQRE